MEQIRFTEEELTELIFLLDHVIYREKEHVEFLKKEKVECHDSRDELAMHEKLWDKIFKLQVEMKMNERQSK